MSFKDITLKDLIGIMVSTFTKVIAVLMIIMLSIFSGCIGSDKKIDNQENIISPLATVKEQRYQKLSQINVPLWDAEDVEFFKKGGDEKASIINVEIYIKPTFYTGSVPFTYKKATTVPGRPGDMQIPIVYNYDDFNVFFIYKDESLTRLGIPSGAMVIIYGKGIKTDILSEARVLELIQQKGGGYWIKIEEVHYRDQEPIFYAESIIKYMTDDKIEEVYTIGTKERDYFFLYPTWSPRT